MKKRISKIEKNIEIKSTKNTGKSIFAIKNFKRGELVLVAYGPVIKKGSKYTIPIDFNLFIDPITYECPARYLNHSCEPSCGIKRRSEIVAIKNIKKGEEINIDYSMLVYDFKYYNWKKKIICNCKSKNCRGEFGSYKNLPNPLKRKYKGFISEFLLKKPKEKYKPS